MKKQLIIVICLFTMIIFTLDAAALIDNSSEGEPNIADNDNMSNENEQMDDGEKAATNKKGKKKKNKGKKNKSKKNKGKKNKSAEESVDK